MAADIILMADDGHKFSAAFSPSQTDLQKRGLVIIQEIFGVNMHIRSLCSRFSELGFTSIAPALFDRVQQDVSLDYSEESVLLGRDLRNKLDWKKPLLDIQASIDHLQQIGCDEIHVIGYCFGGSLAWLSATRLQSLTSVISYYGGNIIDFLDESPKCPIMLHFGETDSAIPLEDVTKLQQKYPDLPVHIYPQAGHGFNCDLRASFNASAAQDALVRSLEFIDSQSKYD
ncbi:MAG: dienelactone hydrolase family protein [Alphaproteobacteria bacterium]|nr:dienelactone hydrolase family protein [Alphaproteobacteria bacterium]